MTGCDLRWIDDPGILNFDLQLDGLIHRGSGNGEVRANHGLFAERHQLQQQEKEEDRSLHPKNLIKFDREWTRMHTNEDEEGQTADESDSDLFWRERTSASSVEPHGCTHIVRNKIDPVALENLSAYIC